MMAGQCAAGLHSRLWESRILVIEACQAWGKRYDLSSRGFAGYLEVVLALLQLYVAPPGHWAYLLLLHICKLNKIASSIWYNWKGISPDHKDLKPSVLTNQWIYAPA